MNFELNQQVLLIIALAVILFYFMRNDDVEGYGRPVVGGSYGPVQNEIFWYPYPHQPTIENPGTTSSLTFFRNFQGLTNGQTNLNQNKLDSMESMVVKSIWFAQFRTDGRLYPIGYDKAQTVSIIVGNQTVVKNLPMQFNQSLNGQSYDRLHFNGGSATTDQSITPIFQAYMPNEIRLLTDIVIPPQVSFEVRVEGSTGIDYNDAAVVCALSGYGKIFSAGSSF